MNPCELTALIAALANTIACKLNDDEISLLASVLVQLGDTLVTVVASRSICQKSVEEIKDYHHTIEKC